MSASSTFRTNSALCRCEGESGTLSAAGVNRAVCIARTPTTVDFPLWREQLSRICRSGNGSSTRSQESGPVPVPESSATGQAPRQAGAATSRRASNNHALQRCGVVAGRGPWCALSADRNVRRHLRQPQPSLGTPDLAEKRKGRRRRSSNQTGSANRRPLRSPGPGRSRVINAGQEMEPDPGT